jgi:MFS family permease
VRPHEPAQHGGVSESVPGNWLSVFICACINGLQFLVAVFASLGSVLYGYDLGVIAEVVASPNFTHLFGNDDSKIGAVVSVFTGGGFFGAFFAGPSGDILGRKRTILLGAAIFLLGGALQTGAQTLAYLYAGRAIAGIG